MWLPDLADASWLTDVLTQRGDALGLDGQVERVRLLDVRLTHPHRPESPRCRGWATCLVDRQAADPVRLYVKGYPDAETARAAWTDDHAVRPNSRSVHLARHDLVVWPFPDDPRLPTMPDLVSPARLPHLLPPAARELLGRYDEGRITVVRYQPEASVTVRVEPPLAAGDGGPSVYAKHLADGSAQQLAERHELLWLAARQGSALRVAEPLGADAERTVLWTRGVPGGPLTASVSEERLAGLAGPVGALLAALHATPVEAPVLTVDELVAELEKKAAKLTAAHAPLGPTMSAVVTATLRRRGEVSTRGLATLHGDFHLDQLVSSESGPVLVDLDSMVLGPREVDLAEFLVDVALRDLPDAVTRDVAAGVLSAYAAAATSPIDEPLLSICADAEFVNRCYRHLRRHAPGWQDDVAAELAQHPRVTALLRP